MKVKEISNLTGVSVRTLHHYDEIGLLVPDGVTEAIGEWYDLLNIMGSYSLEAFKGLGEMYVADERFSKNIAQFGEGLTVFMRDAMAVYADRN